MISKKIIYGCESRGDADSPYLIRYTLIDTKYFQVCVHVFLRSDADDMHDHPWPFASLILWRGYNEVTAPWPKCSTCSQPIILKVAERRYECNNPICWSYEAYRIFCEPKKKSRKYPFQLLIRKATHRHRVELIKEKKAVTLVFMGKRIREWGFFTKSGWLKWTEYFKKMGC